MSNEDGGFYFEAAKVRYQAELDAMRPANIYRPRLFVDGDQWCALYGDNIQDGVAGFGPSPELAYWNFDKAWCEKLPAPAKRDSQGGE